MIGSEIVLLTYRQSYVEDPEGQWHGYRDFDITKLYYLVRGILHRYFLIREKGGKGQQFSSLAQKIK